MNTRKRQGGAGVPVEYGLFQLVSWRTILAAGIKDLGARMERFRPRVCGYRKLEKRERVPIDPLGNLGMYWLKLAHKYVSVGWARQLKEYELLPSDWAALRVLYKHGRKPLTSLAYALGMSKGGTSKLVARLIRQKLVRSKVGPTDRRCRIIGLRIPGERLAEELAAVEFSSDRESFRYLGGRKRRQLFETLRAVVRHARAATPRPTPPAEATDVWGFRGIMAAVVSLNPGHLDWLDKDTALFGPPAATD
jgi:DNA-binding MarR family transcriptional regulator